MGLSSRTFRVSFTRARGLVILLVIFALPRQMPIGPDICTDAVTSWRDRSHHAVDWPD
jgi:hypothetical protein